MRKSPVSFSILVSFVLISLCGWTIENPSERWIVKFRSDRTNLVRSSESTSQLIKRLQSDLVQNVRKLSEARAFSERNVSNSTEYLWAANSIALTVSSDQIKEISSLENVEAVFPVRYRKYLPDMPVSKSDKRPQAPKHWGVAKIKAPEVWSNYKVDGSGIIVGHIDSGVDGKHPMLAGKVIAFKDFTNEATQEAYDDHGHGTHTAGTICASDGYGVAPGAKIVSAKAFTKEGNTSTEILIRAMQWMLDPDGNPETNDAPRIVSNSWGSQPDEDDAAFYAVVENWVSAGILPVFAAGNMPFGVTKVVDTPARFKISWAVGATKTNDGITSFSCQGPSEWNGETYVKPDISAPGDTIISCKVGGGVKEWSGTSMSCPHVAGVAALMLQANPKLTIPEIREIAEKTSIDKEEPGKDNAYGSGRIDAFACISEVVAKAPVANLFEGYMMALEAEKSYQMLSNSSPLAAPMAKYIIEKSRNLDEGEFISLKHLFINDSLKYSILKQAETARNFLKIYDEIH
ncbi:MAG: S8 family serine peptidase [Candidatus Riflebacteria bacterium]|nr:S8 family serine peptidase [Candidatus Riflebacteria bacterium]